MQRDQTVTTGGRKGIGNNIGLSRGDENLVDVVVLVTDVLADRVINVLRGVVFVDGHSQRREGALTIGEVAEKTDIEGGGFVKSGVVMVAFSEKITVLIIPMILQIAG